MFFRLATSVLFAVLLGCASDSVGKPLKCSVQDASGKCARVGRSRPTPESEAILMQIKSRKSVANATGQAQWGFFDRRRKNSCDGSQCKTIKVMSYNTEYRNYDDMMPGYAEQIKEVAPALVGVQECQNRDGLARLSGYTANTATGNQNYMFFDPSKVAFVSGGKLRIPRDDYAERFITWGQFKFGDVTIWFFNTHLPHNHNEARSQTTHAKIAKMFLDKRRDLGAENAPTIMVGDMNSHASNFNRVQGGGFESNLEANGFTLAYTAKGNPGHGGIDHILYSTPHWTHSDCKDTGTGGSDHTSITCDLTLKVALNSIESELERVSS